MKLSNLILSTYTYLIFIISFRSICLTIFINLFLVLRDVLRPECRDAQTDRNLQKTGRDHQTSFALSLWRGKFIYNSFSKHFL